MPASPIRRLVPLAVKAMERGVKVYRLNIGQPDVPTPPEAFEALRNIDRKVLEYSPSDGLLSLRRKLRDYYHRFNIEVDVDDIIVTAGGSEAVLFAFMACLDPGDEIIVPEPAYANYMAFAISAGAKIVTIPSSIDDGFELPPVEKFEELITPRTKGILICNPNNPTGYLYTMKEMLQIRDLVLKHDLFLFSDEVYREFCYTGAPYISAFHLPGIEDKVSTLLQVFLDIFVLDSLQLALWKHLEKSPACFQSFLDSSVCLVALRNVFLFEGLAELGVHQVNIGQSRFTQDCNQFQTFLAASISGEKLVHGVSVVFTGLALAYTLILKS